MEFKRRTEISIKKTRRFVIRQPESSETISCPVCGAPMLTAEASAALFRIKYRSVYRLIEAGAAHFLETAAGAVYICPPSLAAALTRDDASPEKSVEEIEF